MKPFSTYPEDRAKLLELCATVEDADAFNSSELGAAYELADLVKAILEDEQLAVDAGEVK